MSAKKGLAKHRKKKKNPFREGAEEGSEGEEDQEALRKEAERRTEVLLQIAVDALQHKQTQVTNDRLIRPFVTNQKQICVPATGMIMRAVNKLLRKLLDVVEKNKVEDQKEFVIYASKFTFIEDIVIGAFHANPDDIFFKGLDHPDWQCILEGYECYIPQNREEFHKKFEGVYEMLAFGAAALVKGMRHKSSIMKAV